MSDIQRYTPDGKVCYPDIRGRFVSYEEHLRRETAAYEKGWNDCTKMIAEQKGMRLSRRPTDTQREAVKATLPRSGTKGLALWQEFLNRGDAGLTDDEIELTFGWTHQSASAARNGLMNRGLLTDSGLRRKNRRGLNVIVWKMLSPSSKEPDDRRTATDDRPATPSRSGHIHVWVWGKHDALHAFHCRECGATSDGDGS
jgi:hypothetical protein